MSIFVNTGVFMLKRKVTDKLLSWKQTSNKALLITGARQIGKSYAIREFAKQNYASYVEINLLINKEAYNALKTASNTSDFINRILLFSKVPLVEHNTLIFIDEIQEYPEITTIIKGLVEDGRYSYVFSGSMLGTQFKGISSFPVGFVEMFTMRPMDFEEFCWVVGVRKEHIQIAKECLVQHKEVEDYIHDALIKNFRAYIVIGGMPEVVQNYLDSGYSLAKTRELQSSLVEQYKQDISKYAGTRSFEVQSIFDRIPVQLQCESHRFSISSMDKSMRFSSNNQDFLWLANAGVGLMVSQTTEAKTPLRRTEKISKFKLYQSDTGMLVSRFPQSFARAIYLDYKSPNLGGIYENIVAQELAAQNIESWYFSSAETGEVDFLIEAQGGKPLPIEVKSGKKIRAHAALDRLMNIDEYKLSQAIVFSRNNFSQYGKILYLPFYMTMFLNEFIEQEIDFMIAPAIP